MEFWCYFGHGFMQERALTFVQMGQGLWVLMIVMLTDTLRAQPYLRLMGLIDLILQHKIITSKIDAMQTLICLKLK